MSRVLSHLLRDIASLTRYHQDASSRLCFILGARKAIELMMEVKQAPEYVYIILHKPEIENDIEKIRKKVLKEIEIQGYDYKLRSDLGDIITIKTKDRKKEIAKKIAEQNSDEVDQVNKFDTDQVNLHEMASVVVRRKASIEASMGASIVSGDIIQMGDIEAQQEVVIQNLHYEIVGYGISEMSSEEISRSPGRIAIRTLEGRYDQFRANDLKRYRNGYYLISTLPRILGVRILKFRKKDKSNVLVVSQDNGETAVAIMDKAPENTHIAIFIRNSNHKKAVMSTLERVGISPDRVKFIEDNLDKYAKSRPRRKFTHFFLEFPSSETGMRPNPFVNLEEKSIIQYARTQFQGLRAISLIGEDEAQIAYVNHALDPTENQEIILQSFRQGYFSPLVLPEDLKEQYPLDIYALPEIPTISQSSVLDISKIRKEDSYASCWLNVHPLKHKSHAGFVAYFELLLNNPRRKLVEKNIHKT